MLFERWLVSKILRGEKTQTRRNTERKQGLRIHDVGDRVGVQLGYKPPVAYIIITKRCRQAIADITEEDAKKEGFANVEEFKQFWLDRYGKWDPSQEVWVYDFVLDRTGSPSKGSSAGREAGQLESR